MADGVQDKVDVHNIFKGFGHDHPGMGMGMGGLGAGFVGGIVGGALTGRRGLFGGGDGEGSETRIEDTVFNTAVLSKLGNIEAAVPLSAAQTQGVITSTVGQLALGTQQGFANVKDSVQNLSLYLSNQLQTINANVSEQGCKTREVVQAGTTAVLTALKDGTIATLQAELAESRAHGRGRETEFNITQNTNVAVAQAQQQQQQQAVNDRILTTLNGLIISHNQLASATNANLIIGSTGVATGAQTANPVNVRG